MRRPRTARFTAGALLLLAALPAGASAAVERDAAFGNNGGYLRDDFRGDADARGITALPNDGGIVVVGAGVSSTAGSSRFMSVGLYTPDGKLDPFFGPMPDSGRQRLRPGGVNAVANDVVIDASGRIVIVGTAGDEQSANRALVIVRLLRNGEYDTSFGDPVSAGSSVRRGYHVEPMSTRSDGRAIAKQAGGYVVVGAQACTDTSRTCTLLHRYTDDGERDTSTSTFRYQSGFQLTSGLNAVAVNGDGTIDVAGQADGRNADGTFTSGGPQVGTTYVHTADGTLLDGSFRATAVPGQVVAFTGISVKSPQLFDTEAATSFGAVGHSAGQVLRREFLPTGAPSTGLANGGVFTAPVASFATANAVSAQPSGKTIVAGSTNNGENPILGRITFANDAFDPTFVRFPGSPADGSGVLVEPSLANPTTWNAISQAVVDASGRLVVYTAGRVGGESLVARYVVAQPPVVAASTSKGTYAEGETGELSYATLVLPGQAPIVVTQISIDGAATRTVAGAETGKLPLPPVVGNHTVTVSAEDREGLRATRTLAYTVSGDRNRDSDQDGLLDRWEQTGDIDGDGKRDLDLAAMGADPMHKDIFVRLDDMVGHKLPKISLRRVAKGFRDSPLTNPDGKTGISLHLDHGSNSLMDIESGKTWGKLSTAQSVKHADQLGTYDKKNDYEWTAFDKLRPTNVTAAMQKVFRYGISAHQYAPNGSSGLARGIPESDFFITMGTSGEGCGDAKITDCTYGTGDEQARTVMHELGHTLGLRHGGTDNTHYKPQFPSVMNYLFQFSGAPGVGASSGRFDYSGIASPTVGDLDENNLDESIGVPVNAIPADFRSKYYCTDGKSIQDMVLGAGVDFDCDGKLDTGTISGSLAQPDPPKPDDPKPPTPPKRRALMKLPAPTTTDWSHIAFVAGRVGVLGTAAKPKTTTVDEASKRLLRRIARLSSGDAKAPTIRFKPSTAKPKANKAFTLKITAKDNRKIDALRLIVDGKPARNLPKTVPGKGRATATPRLTLKRGLHRVAVIVTDTTGNIEAKVARIRVR